MTLERALGRLLVLGLVGFIFVCVFLLGVNVGSDSVINTVPDCEEDEVIDRVWQPEGQFICVNIDVIGAEWQRWNQEGNR